MGEAADFTADQEMIDLVNSCAVQVPGLKVVDHPLNFGGSEDATILCRRVQAHGGKASYFMWGTDRPAAHHAARFDVVEADMDNAFALWQKILPAILK